VQPAVSTVPLMCLPAGSSVPAAVIVSGWQETQAVSPPATVGWFVTGGTPWQRPQAASPVPTLVQVGAVLVPSASVAPWHQTVPQVGVCGFHDGFIPFALATPPNGTSVEPSRCSGEVKLGTA